MYMYVHIYIYIHTCICLMYCTNSILWRSLAFSVNLRVSMGSLKGDKLPFQSLRVFERSYIWYCHRTIHLILFSNMGLPRHTQWLWGLTAVRRPSTSVSTFSIFFSVQPMLSELTDQCNWQEHIPGASIPMASWGLATPRLGRVKGATHETI